MIGVRTFKEDYAIGKAGEARALPIIKEYFNSNIEQLLNNFSRFDYTDKQFKYELKTRTNRYSAYPTTLMPVDKATDDLTIFLFQFTDGLYWIRYNAELFSTFETKQFVRNQRADYNDKQKDYFFIPISELTPISIPN
jgi:hypothetical protein